MSSFVDWFDRRANDVMVWISYRRKQKMARAEEKNNRPQLPKPPRGWKPGNPFVSEQELEAARAIRAAVDAQSADSKADSGAPGSSRREVKESAPQAPLTLAERVTGIFQFKKKDPQAPPPMPRRLPAMVREPRHFTSRELLTRNVLIAVTVIIFGFFGNLFFLSHLQHEVSQQQLSNQFRQELALATAPVSEGDKDLILLPNGAPVAVLTIPDLGVNEVVVEGTDSASLKKGPGHRRDTVLPGQAGVSVIMARAAAYGGPFGNIQSLQPGTRISLITGQGYHVYSVIGVRYAGDPGPAEPAEGVGRLILEPARGGPYTPDGVLRVDAQLVSTSKTAPGQAETILAQVTTAKSSSTPAVSGTATSMPNSTSAALPTAGPTAAPTPTTIASAQPTTSATPSPTGAPATDTRNPAIALASVKALDPGPRYTGTNTLALNERELATDTTMLWALIFALQLLIVVEIAAIWAYRRVGLEKTWIVFIPIFLLTGLLVSDQLVRLLPNLL